MDVLKKRKLPGTGPVEDTSVAPTRLKSGSQNSPGGVFGGSGGGGGALGGDEGGGTGGLGGDGGGDDGGGDEGGGGDGGGGGCDGGGDGGGVQAAVSQDWVYVKDIPLPQVTVPLQLVCVP